MLDRQNALSAARGRELKALTDCNKVVSELQRALSTTLTNNSVTIASRWALSDFGKVDAFFRLKFARPLPVSALGQTETYNRLGFDHREAIDVAVHPDSVEGEALINYLRGQGISFIAIRYAIAGSATGAHIHIGPSSKRIVLR